MIAVETQGHGRTNDREGPETFQQDADDVAALVQVSARSARRIFWVSAMAAVPVLQIAIRHPDLVDKIIPISGLTGGMD